MTNAAPLSLVATRHLPAFLMRPLLNGGTLARLMGRQLSVLLDPTDERRLLEFLHSSGDIRIFEAFADRMNDVEVSLLPPPLAGHLSFTIWPTRFLWEPEFTQTQTIPPRWYIRNDGTAPILKYSRPPLSGTDPGRLYWADRFCGEPSYDRVAFGKWVDSIWRWVRRSSSRMLFANQPVWCFAEAAATRRLVE